MFFTGDQMKKVILKAKKEKFGIIASNVVFDTSVRAMVQGYNAMGADGLLQISSGACKYAAGGTKDLLVGAKFISDMVKNIANQYAKSGVGLNIDHGAPKDMDFIIHCIENGLVSTVMIDASHESFEDNVRLTKEVVAVAHKHGVLVEGEIGYIKGNEDELVSDSQLYTDPQEALEYVKKTNVDLFAASVGTNHGVTKGADVVLRLELIKEIDDLLNANGLDAGLVLHGASGLTVKQQQDAVANGVVKINKDTRYQMEIASAVQAYWEAEKDAIVCPSGTDENAYSPDKGRFDPRKWLIKGEDAMQSAVESLVEIVGAKNTSILS